MRYPEFHSNGNGSEEFAVHHAFTRNGHGPRKMRQRSENLAPEKTGHAALRREVISYPTMTPGYLFDATETHKAQLAYPEYSDLLTLFVAHRGIEAVYRVLGSSPINDGNIENDNFHNPLRSDAVRYATGTVFERLAYYSLKQQSDPDSLYLDPGSSSRIFNRLNNRQPFYCRPDGATISFPAGKAPVISQLIEYKVNPVANTENTRISLDNMTNFLDHNKGLLFHFSPRLIIDDTRKIDVKHLTISGKPATTLVIPEDRSFDAPPNVNVVKTPFDSFFVNVVTRAVLGDISKK